MTLAFDTLKAADSLREAGVDERAAKAIVAIVQRTTELPDIAHLATKTDLALLKSDLEAFEHRIDAKISEKLRQQLLAFLALNAALAGLVVAIVRAFP